MGACHAKLKIIFKANLKTPKMLFKMPFYVIIIISCTSAS